MLISKARMVSDTIFCPIFLYFLFGFIIRIIYKFIEVCEKKKMQAGRRINTDNINALAAGN